MGDITRDMMNRFRRGRIRARRYTAGFLAAATLVGCGVGWGLRQTGISATADTFCGAEEHTHTQQCYEKVLVCGMEEGETLPTEAPHVHEESCYGLQKVCVCGAEAHAHSDACYTMQRNLTCTSWEHSHGDACYTTSGGELTCAAAEHTHSDECKDAEGNLTCDQQGHSHGDGCFSPVERTLSCTLTEHTHDDSCYGDAERVLICGHGEHEHTDACYEEQQVLVCTLSTEPEAQTPHVHAEACYEERRICGKEEHSHTDQCLSDPTADVEDADAWSANACNPGSGVWAADLLGVASAQLGYAESQRNFRVDENGIRRGYTRYGAWYGDPYGSWNGMFLAYCLHFAGVPESTVSQRAGVSALLADLSGSDRLKNPDDYTPQPGDIAVFGDRVGVIREAGETLTVICGDVDGKVAELSVAAGSITKYIAVSLQHKMANSINGTYTLKTVFFSQETVDLKDYLSGVSISYGDPVKNAELKNNNNQEITLKQNEPITVSIDYTFQPGFSTKQATYDLNAGIKPSSLDGLVLDESGKKVGTFVIEKTEEGISRVIVTYDDSLWENSDASHTGYIRFSGNANLNENNDQTTISFPGVGTLTVNKQEDEQSKYKTELSKTRKTGFTVDGNNVTVSYEVVLSSETGTDPNKTLTITDYLNSNLTGITYDTSSVTVTKQKSDGSDSSSISVSPQIGQNNNQPMMTIENLPALGKDEKYVLTYVVTVPKSSFAGNDGKYLSNSATDGDHYKGDYGYETVKKLTKSSYLDNNTGEITWTITVNNPLGENVKDYKVWDVLPEEVKDKVFGNVTITYKDSNNNQQEYKTLEPGSDGYNQVFGDGYTFGDDAEHTSYEITFKTKSPDLGDLDEIKVKNTAGLQPKDEEPFTVEREQTVTRKAWSLSKQRTAVDEDKGTVSWSVNAENAMGSKSITLQDTILDAVRLGDNSKTPIQGTHYADREELNNALKDQNTGLYVILDDGTDGGKKVTWSEALNDSNSGVTFTVTYTPESGNVTGFTVKADSTQYSIVKLHVDSYPTHVDLQGISSGETRIFENDAVLGNVKSAADYVYGKSADFQKSVSLDGGATWHTGEEQDVGTTYAKLMEVAYGKIYYQISFTTDENQEFPVTFTDHLPIDASCASDFWLKCDNNNFWERYFGQSGNDLTLSIFNSYSQLEGKKHTWLVGYCIDITKDPTWQDSDISFINYHNAAVWGNKTSETDSLIKRFDKDLDKLSKQIYTTAIDTNGNEVSVATNRVEYTVVINPNQKDLAGGTDTFVLKDTVNLGGIKGGLDFSNFNLYYFKESSSGDLDLTESVPIPKLDYSMDAPLHFEITVPNRTALVLRYYVEVDKDTVPPSTTSFDISNNVELTGGLQSHNVISFKDEKAVGGINSDRLRIIKKDADTGALITGATFNVASYDSTVQKWSTLKEIEITNGQKYINISELTNNTLYCIWEKKAPENYQLDSTPKFLIFYSDDSSSNAFSTASGGKTAVTGPDGSTQVTADSPNLLIRSVRGTTSIEFKNEYLRLDVEKIWIDQKNNKIDGPTDSVKVQLKRYKAGNPDAKENVGDPVELTKADGWVYHWDNLEKQIDGVDCYYMVEEVLPSQDWKMWTVAYVNNSGIQTGKIYITNKVSNEYSYKLPNTGGSGTRNYVLFGTIAMILAGCGMVVTRKKHYTGVYER